MATTLRDQISAKNRADVEAQTAPDQMWESMSNQYDQQAKQIQQGYDRAYSQADNQLLSRGMGRSSYGGQVLANISKQGVDAQTQNHNDLIAAYQNWLASYNTQQEQFQWQKDSADRQIALGFLNNIAANGGTPSDELLARAGISRPDFDAMKYQAPVVSGGGGSRGGGSSYTPKPNPDPGDNGDDNGDTGLIAGIDKYVQSITNPTVSKLRHPVDEAKQDTHMIVNPVTKESKKSPLGYMNNTIKTTIR